MKQCNRSRLKAIEKRLEAAESALKIILTWATFEYDGPQGHLRVGNALVPKHVEDLIRRTLQRIK